jgi:hypothetical protein
MRDWPPIEDPELLRRLAAGDEEFLALMRGFISSVGPRDFGDAEFERALGYPWPRPPSSFVLDGTAVEHVDAWGEISTEGRWPLLTFGSNGAPETLIRKFAHLPPDQRRIPVLAGDLHDFDVGAAGNPAAYGAFPATLFVSPGTALRASVLFVTAEQLTALTWTEVSYRLGRLDGVRFEPDASGSPAVDHVLAYASRWGSHCIDGDVAALAALPARNRTVPEFTQEELLDLAAARAIGPGARARDLVAWIFADFAAAADRIWPLIQPDARPLESERWSAYPAGQPREE